MDGAAFSKERPEFSVGVSTFPSEPTECRRQRKNITACVAPVKAEADPGKAGFPLSRE